MFNYDPKRDGPEAKDLFDKLYKDISFDKKLYKKLHNFRLNWLSKGVEYPEFLGGNTLGVHTIRFSTRDDDHLLVDIFNADPLMVLGNIKKLPDIDASWAVSTNPILQTLTYTMHRFIIDDKLGSKLDEALKECYYIFAYKVFGSLLSNYFRYNTTPAIAKATFEKLSNRFLIKKYGTWNAVLEHRANSVLPPAGLHSERLLEYTTNDSIRIVNDLQGGIREHIKSIYEVMLDVTTNKTSIGSSSLLGTTGDGDDTTKSITNRPDRYVNKLRELMGNPLNLIDDDIIHLTTQFIRAGDAALIKDTLLRLSEDYNPKDRDSVYIESIILNTIAYCNTKGIMSDYRSNILEVINYMKGYWSSGSVKDKDVKRVKKVISLAVKKSTKRRTQWVLSANTLAVIVYLFIVSVK